MTSLAVDDTHDPALRSGIPSANVAGCDFPLQTLPFGRFRRKASADAFRTGVAIGDQVLDVRAVGVIAHDDMNAVMALPSAQRHALLLTGDCRCQSVPMESWLSAKSPSKGAPSAASLAAGATDRARRFRVLPDRTLSKPEFRLSATGPPSVLGHSRPPRRVHAAPGQRPQSPPFPLRSYLDVDAGWIPFRTPPPGAAKPLTSSLRSGAFPLHAFCS